MSKFFAMAVTTAASLLVQAVPNNRTVTSSGCVTFANIPCERGCYLNTETRHCEPVLAGRYSPDRDNLAYKCSSGHFSLGHTETCTPCPTGQFARNKGNKQCYPCGIAQYNSKLGASRCKTCNPALYIGYGSQEVVKTAGLVFCLSPTLTIPPTEPPTTTSSPTSQFAPFISTPSPTAYGFPTSNEPLPTAVFLPSVSPSGVYPAASNNTTKTINQKETTSPLWMVFVPNFAVVCVLTGLVLFLIARPAPVEEDLPPPVWIRTEDESDFVEEL